MAYGQKRLDKHLLFVLKISLPCVFLFAVFLHFKLFWSHYLLRLSSFLKQVREIEQESGTSMQTAELSFVQGQDEQQDTLYFTVLYKSYRL